MAWCPWCELMWGVIKMSQFQALSLIYTLIEGLLCETGLNEWIVRRYVVKTYLSVGILFIRASQTVTSPLIGMVWFLSSSIRRARKHAWPSRAISAKPFNPGRSITETFLLNFQEYSLIYSFCFSGWVLFIQERIVHIRSRERKPLFVCYLNHSYFIPNLYINSVLTFLPYYISIAVFTSLNSGVM